MQSARALENTPLVSVIITCFNNEKTIFKAIKSVTDQSYQNLQIIVVDDFSTDKSRDIVLKFSDPRCQLISMPKNSGVSSARNAGYRHATGEFVTQLDGDDYIHFEKIENEVRAAAEHKGAAVFSKFVVVHNGIQVFRFGDLFRSSSTISYLGILYRAEYIGRDWLIPRIILEEIDFDESRSLYEDWQFAIHVARKTDVIYIDKIGTYYVKSNGSLSAKPWKYHRAALNDIFSGHSSSKTGSRIFSFINRSQYLGKLITLILNWTRIYKFFPD